MRVRGAAWMAEQYPLLAAIAARGPAPRGLGAVAEIRWYTQRSHARALLAVVGSSS